MPKPNLKFIKIFYIILILFCCIFTTPIINVAAEEEDLPASQTWNNYYEEYPDAIEEDIELMVPIFGLVSVKNMGEYIYHLYSMALWIILPFLIIFMMLAGALWVIAGGDKNLIAKAKDRIKHGFIGLGIVLTSYILLSLIGLNELKNPGIAKIEAVDIMPLELVDIALNSGGMSAGEEGNNLPAGELVELGKQVAKELGIDPCVVVTKFKMESGANPNAIGHDANAKGTSAYRLCSSHPDCRCRNKSDKNITGAEDLGLDWRYSHGIGMGQLTFFPKQSGWCTNMISRKFSGQCITPRQALSARKNIELSLRLWKANFNGSDYRTAFRRYNGSGPMAEKYATKAMQIFNRCKSGGG